MIIVQFHGGLGNQMFQYIFYTELKKKYPNITIKADLDCYIYERYKVHNGFELDRIFNNIKLDIATTEEILSCDGSYERHKEGVVDIIKKMFFNTRQKMRIKIGMSKCVFEKDWNFYNNLSEEELISKNFWLSGYWANLNNRIIPEFEFKYELDGLNLEYLKKMRSSNSVGIHVRRGDYVGTFLDVVGVDYYREAITFLMQRYKDLVFYVFSDDKKYVEDIFAEYTNCTIVENNVGELSYIDMELMSNCKHNIICNSTFSTWGALLNKNPEKVVIYPKPYLDNISFTEGEWIGI